MPNAVPRAVDELRRAQIVRIDSPGGSLDVLAVELADAPTLALLEAGRRAGLVVTHRRAAVLHLVNQIGAAGHNAVWIDRPGWLDLTLSVATVDPISDLATPLKGPFRTRDTGALGEAAAAALRLAKLGELLPAVFAVPVPPGSVSSAPPSASQVSFDEAPLRVEASAVLGYARADRLRIVARAQLPLAEAPATEVVAFRPAEGGPEHLALLIGPAPAGSAPASSEPAVAAPLLVRLHSACLTGDVLGSLKCDCGPQLRAAVAAIAADPRGGILLYLQQEGRGIGLINKLRAYALQDQGLDTVDANLRLGFESDERDFAVAATMLRQLGVGAVRLLTNNPDKVASLQDHGIVVAARVAHAMPPNPHNAAYLDTKRDRSGHYL